MIEKYVITHELLVESIESLTKPEPRKDMAWHNAFDLENFKPVEAL